MPNIFKDFLIFSWQLFFKLFNCRDSTLEYVPLYTHTFIFCSFVFDFLFLTLKHHCSFISTFSVLKRHWCIKPASRCYSMFVCDYFPFGEFLLHWYHTGIHVIHGFFFFCSIEGIKKRKRLLFDVSVFSVFFFREVTGIFK